MTSMRENPIRRRPPSRQPWLLPAVIVGAVAVAVALVIVVVRLLGGSDDTASSAEATPSASCSTVMAAPADELPLPEKVKVNVYNATDTSGLASQTARDLKRRGFAVLEVANDPVGLPIEGVARIRYGPNSAQRAELLAYYIPGAELVEIKRKGPKIDLAIGDLFTQIAPQAEVDATLNAPTPELVGAGCFGVPATGTPATGTPAIEDVTIEESPSPLAE
ncbi:MAG TPA: hypothetical protein DCQ36_00555 [Actinobacteria bacterium]|jgi:hypothetical protein|nr:hypothetical protein [Actinomycetota bacterium]